MSLAVKLRQKGAYGIGDGEGTYVDKEHATKYMNDILKTRMDSIASDLSKIRELSTLMEKDGVPKPICLVERESRSKSLTMTSAINILLALLNVVRADFRDDTLSYKQTTIWTILTQLGICDEVKEMYSI